MQNSKRKPLYKLNKTQANTNNNSLSNLNDQTNIQFNDIISNNDSQNNFILAMSSKDDENIFSNKTLKFGNQVIHSTKNNTIPTIRLKQRIMSIDHNKQQIQPFQNFNNLL